MTQFVTGPQDTHNRESKFDLKIAFTDRRIVTEENALILDSRHADHLAHFGEEQLALEHDLHVKGSIIFIGDTHLCHEFNEKEFDQLIDTIEVWIKSGKIMDRVVFYGDLLHKFDPRFTKLKRNEHGSFYTNAEPYCEVIKRYNKAFAKLNRLRQVLPSETEVDYIFGNHEHDICVQHKKFYDHFISGLKALHINLLTDDFKELVTIGDEKDAIKASHIPLIKWNTEVTKRLFKTDKDVSFFRTVKEFPFYIDKKSKSKISPGDNIIGGHFHVPWAWKDDHQQSFIFAPSLIHHFSEEIPCFREGFMVINPKASKKVHMVSAAGQAMEFDLV